LQRTLFLVASCCVLACRLPADTLTATAASAAADSGPVCHGPDPLNCQAGISASSASFTLLGSGPNPIIPFTEQGTFAAGFQQTLPAFIPGTVQPGFGHITGVSSPVLYYGTFIVTGPDLQATVLNPPEDTIIQLSYGSIVELITPSSPNASFILPANIQGTFTACASTTPFPPLTCDSSSPNFLANIMIDLPGHLVWDVNVNDGLVTLDESFTNLPEPATYLLAALGIALLVALRRRAKNA
jgi:hypothetical protein